MGTIGTLQEVWCRIFPLQTAHRDQAIAADIAKLPKPAEAVLTSNPDLVAPPARGRRVRKWGRSSGTWLCAGLDLRYVKAAVGELAFHNSIFVPLPQYRFDRPRLDHPRSD